jgi:hypothetical protein
VFIGHAKFSSALGQGSSLYAVLLNPDGVERDIDCRRLVDDAVEMAGHRVLVERVDLRAFRRSAGGPDFFGNAVEGVRLTPGQKDARAFAGKRTRDRGADSSCGTVDDGVLVFQQHDGVSNRR